MSDDAEDLTREVQISAPYDEDVKSTVLLESIPVWFDLGWQKVDGEDYGLYGDLEPAPRESSLSVVVETQDAVAKKVAAPKVQSPAEQK